MIRRSGIGRVHHGLMGGHHHVGGEGALPVLVGPIFAQVIRNLVAGPAQMRGDLHNKGRSCFVMDL